MDAMAQLPLTAGLGTGTFPAKLWSLVNDPRVLSLCWDSEARGLLVDRSLFERELLRPGGAQGLAPHAFRAMQFRSFVRLLYRYGFRKVPGQGWRGCAGRCRGLAPLLNPWIRRDRPDLLLRIRHRSAANTQRRWRGGEGRSPLPPAAPSSSPGHGRCRTSGTGALTFFQPLPRERPPLASRLPPCSFHLLHRERPGPARREGPSRFQELYGSGRCRPPAGAAPAAPGTSAPHAPAGSAGCAASTASSSAQNAPAQEESPALDLGQAIEKMIREIRNSLPVKAPSAQGNINVAPESPREDPMNRAAAEEASSGTESCRNSSPEPEEPGERPWIHRLGSDRREFLSFQLGSERFVVAAGAAQVAKRRWEHEEIQAEE
ncbi:hypothetical protein DUI87_30483 [Hirundo rustica rustica]|uniref:HSF-type DNA-binding domain-containing protein n=1 Tax=Hirundo rustica rustica TaxID=333673 RepID=A0A3M0IUW6_HIRRU|nr:hypothetical protein DUI87_30483 [Hirundo rustica rustica]